MRTENPLPEGASFPWRVPPEAFSYHAPKLRLLAKELEQLGFPFALTNTDIDPLTVFVVVDCTPLERDRLSKLLDSQEIGFQTSVITLHGYRAMLPNLGNHQPWVLGDPSGLLGSSPNA
jgi:hypothetical protein